MKRYDLLVAQPSLTLASYFSPCITLRHPLTRLRWTNFVETMLPCFHRDLLIRCLPLLDDRIGGWGLDWVWAQEAGPAPGRVAIIDQVAVTHTRPFGGPNYRFFQERGTTPEEEELEIMRLAGITSRITRTYDLLTRGGVRLRGNSAIGRALLRVGYRLIIWGLYVRRDPRRWDLDKRLTPLLSRPDEIQN
jgi:hypothetical protein